MNAPAILTKFKSINLGCGDDIRPDHLNVDLNHLKGPHVVADIQALTGFPSQFYDVVVVRNVFQEMTLEASKNAFSECARILSPSGVIKVGVPTLIGLFGSSQMQPWSVASLKLMVFQPPIFLHWAKVKGLMLSKATLRDGWQYDLEFVNDRITSDAEFIHHVFLEFLGRPAKNDNLTFFESELASGRLTRRGVVTALWQSDERRALTTGPSHGAIESRQAA